VGVFQNSLKSTFPTTQKKHHVNLPFGDEDKKEVKRWGEGGVSALEII